MTQMASKNAIQGAPNSITHCDHVPTSDMEWLHNMKLVTEIYSGNYQLTALGVAKLTLAQTIQKLGDFCSATPPTKENMFEMCSSSTRWELMLYLNRTGWVDIESETTSVEPYKSGSKKEYFILKKKTSVPLYHSYLSCLVLAERLFSSGVTSLMHFQPNGYYSTMISLAEHADKPSYRKRLERLLPNQTLTYYREVLSRAEKGIDPMDDNVDESSGGMGSSGQRHSNAHQESAMLEDEPSLDQPSTAIHASSELDRGRGRPRGRGVRGRGGVQSRGRGKGRGKTKRMEAEGKDDDDNANSQNDIGACPSPGPGPGDIDADAIEVQLETEPDLGVQQDVNELSSSSKGVGKTQPSEATVVHGSFFSAHTGLSEVGVAVSSRSTCGLCREKIAINTIRFAWFSSRQRPSIWLHEKCVPSMALTETLKVNSVRVLRKLVADLEALVSISADGATSAASSKAGTKEAATAPARLEASRRVLDVLSSQ